MKYYIALLSAVCLLGTGCSERDDEEVDIDRIVQLLNEEEPMQWQAPSDVEMISGSFSPEEGETSQGSVR
jgi:hypothetical protein